jgi:hypothetical protein
MIWNVFFVYMTQTYFYSKDFIFYFDVDIRIGGLYGLVVKTLGYAAS